MMKRFSLLVLTAMLTISSASVFTACTADNYDRAVIVTDDKPFDRNQYIDKSVSPGDDFYRYVLGQWIDDENQHDLNSSVSSVLIGIRDRAMLESNDPVMTAIRQLEAEAEIDCSADMELFKSRINTLSTITTQAELEAAFTQLHQLGYTPLLRQISTTVNGVLKPALVSATASPYTYYPMSKNYLGELDKEVKWVCRTLSKVGVSDERIEEIYQHAMVIEKLEMQIFSLEYDQEEWQKTVPVMRTRGAGVSPVERYSQLIGLGDLSAIMVLSSDEAQVIYQLLDMLWAGNDESVALMRDYLIYYVMAQDMYFVPQLTPTDWYYWRWYYAAHSHPYFLNRIEAEAAKKEDIQKEKCGEMLEEIRQLLINRIDQSDWMTDATKQEAKKKAKAMMFFIGYPDQWDEEFLPVIEGSTLLEAVGSLRRQAVAVQRRLVGRDLRTHGWGFWCSRFLLFGLTITSHYNYTANQLYISPNYLMSPYFDIQQSEATLYAVASIFGHEMGHGFDDMGRYYNEYGVKGDWFTDEDSKVFDKKQQKMIALWNQLEAYPGQPADGLKTLPENMADLTGVTLAYEVYKRRLKKQGYSGSQFDEQLRKFWISYAYFWANENERSIEWLKWLYQNDIHSVSCNRVNGIVRLFDDWYRLFDIKPTDKLYLAPEDRVKIW